MILLTGNAGYIGSVMTKFLMDHSYKVIGLDSMYFRNCEFMPEANHPYKQITKDIRDIEESDLNDVTGIIHLAALSNDPLGEMNPMLTEDINFKASLRLAKLAKENGVERFIFSSSCSMYGIASDDRALTEEDEFNPITAYAKAKVCAEEEISKLADKNFHPVFMRNATVYGVSPILRLCLVVNNLVAWAFLTGKVAIMSDGSPWRPIIHVEDLCRAFLAALEAPVENIHNQAFNVGIDSENFQVRDIGEQVEKIVPNCQLEILNRTGPDERTYRVDFSKINKILPSFKPVWNLEKGVEELYHAYKQFGLQAKDLDSAKYFRVRWIRYLMENNELDNSLKFN